MLGSLISSAEISGIISGAAFHYKPGAGLPGGPRGGPLWHLGGNYVRLYAGA